MNGSSKQQSDLGPRKIIPLLSTYIVSPNLCVLRCNCRNFASQILIGGEGVHVSRRIREQERRRGASFSKLLISNTNILIRRLLT